MSPDGPTRARMALIATIALVLTVALGALRGRLRWHPTTWRVLHGYLAVVVIALGLGHALLTDGALDGAGTAVLVALMARRPARRARRPRRASPPQTLSTRASATPALAVQPTCAAG